MLTVKAALHISKALVELSTIDVSRVVGVNYTEIIILIGILKITNAMSAEEVYFETVTSLPNKTVSYTSLHTSSNITIYTNPPHPVLLYVDESQMVMTLIGTLANIVSCIALGVNSEAFSTAIFVLLRNQAVCDALICALAFLTLLTPEMWLPGMDTLDVFMCYIWHSQHINWTLVVISVWNLVFLAYERWLAVCRPFQHQKLTKSKLYLTITLLYIICFIGLSPGFIQIRLENGVCEHKYFMDGRVVDIFFSVYATAWFFILYAIPSLLFILLYGMVIFAFQKRKKKSDQLGSSRVIDKATSELTKTAITVTIIFFLTISFDTWYYILGRYKVVKYTFNSPVQKASMWLASFNSFANPFIYGLLVPAYRQSLSIMFCPVAKK